MQPDCSDTIGLSRILLLIGCVSGYALGWFSCKAAMLEKRLKAKESEKEEE